MSDAPKPRVRPGIRIEADPAVPVAYDEATGEAFYLRPEWSATLERCDGSHDAAAIAAAVDGDVWASLDALADLNLLEERVAPPAGSSQVTRRGLLRATAVAGAVVAAVAVGTHPAAANQPNAEEKLKQQAAREQSQKNKQEEKDKRKNGEQAAKESDYKSR
jgi:hypothetical protein